MKKIIFFLLFLCVVAGMSAQQRRAIYVDPVQNNTDLRDNIANRLYKKGVLGLTKARTIAVTAGDHKMTPGSEEALNYDYILTPTVSKIDATDIVGDIKEVVGGVKELFGKKSDDKSDRKPRYTTTIYTDIVITDAKTGEKVYSTQLACQSTNEDKNVGYFDAANGFNGTMLDMADDVFKITGEVIEATEVDKKGKVKKVRAQIGSKAGARKDLWFDLYKVTDGQSELLGAAKCEQVLNGDESILSVTGKKGGDKALNDALSNIDGSYTITVASRSKGGLAHDFGFDKHKFQSARAPYLDPVGRNGKTKVAFIDIESYDQSMNGRLKDVTDMILKALGEATAIEVVPKIYGSVADAKAEGVDGLLSFTVDMVTRTSEPGKNYKGEAVTKYTTKMYYTLTAVDVNNNTWIDMLSSDYSSTEESQDKADLATISHIDDKVKNFSEDAFPVSCTVLEAKKANDKKFEVKEISVNAGTAYGLRKGMIFDIYEQRKEGGDDARFLIAEGKVKGDGLTATEAILSVKGKNDGDKALYDLIKNMNEDTELILISKANHGVFGFIDNVMGIE